MVDISVRWEDVESHWFTKEILRLEVTQGKNGGARDGEGGWPRPDWLLPREMDGKAFLGIEAQTKEGAQMLSVINEGLEFCRGVCNKS